MKEANFEFDKLIAGLHHNIGKLEELSFCESRNLNLTINELHLLECIQELANGDEGPTISAIANEMDITRPSTTVAVNKLKDKKYVEKIGCVNDGRSVRIKLTTKGKKIYALHNEYHTGIMEALNGCLSDSEKEAFISTVGKINEFFNSKIEEIEAEEFDQF